MKKIIWYLTTDTDGGLSTELFATQEDARAALRSFISECWDDWMDKDDGAMPEDMDMAWDILCEGAGFIDTFTLDYAVVDTSKAEEV